MMHEFLSVGLVLFLVSPSSQERLQIALDVSKGEAGFFGNSAPPHMLC